MDKSWPGYQFPDLWKFMGGPGLHLVLEVCDALQNYIYMQICICPERKHIILCAGGKPVYSPAAEDKEHFRCPGKSPGPLPCHTHSLQWSLLLLLSHEWKQCVHFLYLAGFFLRIHVVSVIVFFFLALWNSIAVTMPQFVYCIYQLMDVWWFTVWAYDAWTHCRPAGLVVGMCTHSSQVCT